VVTVVRNGRCLIAGTALSVLSQRGVRLEYLVIDGGSTDGTLKALKKAVRGKGRLRVRSGPDRGIYDAMNKGLRQARGTWIAFMNAGDSFRSPDSLKRLIDEAGDSDGAWGDVEVCWEAGAPVLRRAREPHRLAKGPVCCHQALILRTVLAKQHPFDLRWRIAADFDQQLAIWRSGARLAHAPFVVARVAAGGVSEINRLEALTEFRKIHGEREGNRFAQWRLRSLWLREWLASRLRNLLGTGFTARVRRLRAMRGKDKAR
jgi:glycosyltransferase involved in cell wall biosynthesis